MIFLAAGGGGSAAASAAAAGAAAAASATGAPCLKPLRALKIYAKAFLKPHHLQSIGAQHLCRLRAAALQLLLKFRGLTSRQQKHNLVYVQQQLELHHAETQVLAVSNCNSLRSAKL